MSSPELHHAREEAKESTKELEEALEHFRGLVAVDSERVSSAVDRLRARAKFWLVAAVAGSVVVNFGFAWILARAMREDKSVRGL